MLEGLDCAILSPKILMSSGIGFEASIATYV